MSNTNPSDSQNRNVADDASVDSFISHDGLSELRSHNLYADVPKTWMSIEDTTERRYEEMVWRFDVLNRRLGRVEESITRREKYIIQLEDINTRIARLEKNHSESYADLHRTMTSTFLAVDVMMRHMQRMEERYKLKLERKQQGTVIADDDTTKTKNI